MVSNILLFCQLLIALYSFYINFKNSEYMKRFNMGNSMICYAFLGMISNNIDNIYNIYTKVIITFVMFLILINELNTIKILKNNDTDLTVEKI